ncbi:hemerythrin domain-containing protein [Paraburkholderia diazotrophica]|uniref:Hemerythrin HHE cation binding domain-containing protein n=1 Tax=Paraburkholderia diazotrophica TaxID=667676 RepID=A0A1H7BKT9_9BURK|nr:hemerythrin domain-containing protein [Paraburkholderia diazotrophica]SEJ75172.1 Hemerythrin HHE cation binding domain-containing protein [Paraburkholderia diazotrophica]
MSEDANKELAAEAAVENAAHDAIEVLKSDHRVAEQLFDAFHRTADTDHEAKRALVQRACEELTVHTLIEEEILYPAAYKALEHSEEIDVDEAYVEHFVMKTLIARFESLKPGDRGFDATFEVLSGIVRHHIEEEESVLFPELLRSGVDLVTLGEEIATRKEVLMKRLEAAGSKPARDGSATLDRGTK